VPQLESSVLPSRIAIRRMSRSDGMASGCYSRCALNAPQGTSRFRMHTASQATCW
jgi:hypothetical protein